MGGLGGGNDIRCWLSTDGWRGKMILENSWKHGVGWLGGVDSVVKSGPSLVL